MCSDAPDDIEPLPAKVSVEVVDGLPRLVPREAMPPLTDEQVRDTLEAVRASHLSGSLR
jgi:hypothetical protein